MNIPDAIKISPLAMMGPGPSNVPESVLAALAQPTLGHLDPHFLHLMDEVRSMLRQLFVTENKVTLPVSATGSAAMETALFNAIEKDDRVIIGVNGVFSDRMAQIAERTGAEVVRVNGEWGRSLTVEDFRKAAAGRSFKAVGVVHAETSTGVLQRVEDFRAFADEVGGLLIVDAVASLAGMPFNTDELGVDIAFSASQKCLSCPPGLAPLTVSEHANKIIGARKTP
ncbi:aminotransferase class V-fold PLP-dependent enzyme, partial [Myxococcota bacterium]|nr:aminotransferase class V-fold PLP-dependent enzyme [Myxococcota bacterium]